MGFYLDSLVRFKQQFYPPESRTRPKTHSRWTRLNLPIHSALFLIRSTSSQSIRGTGSIVAGVFTLDTSKMESGIRDYGSVIVQMIALPIIGITAAFSPNMAKSILDFFLYYSSEKISERYIYLQDHFIEQSTSLVGKEITCFIRGTLVGVPVCIIDGLTVGISSILQGEIGCGLKEIYTNCVIRSVGSLLKSPLGFDDKYYESISKIATNKIFLSKKEV